MFLMNSVAKAQQDPQFSMYMYNRQVYNPAVPGSMPLNITTAGRAQWVGIDGHPNTFNLSVQSPVALLKGGLGGYVMADKIGPLSTVAVKASYAFNLPIGKNGAGLNFGIGGGILQKSLDGTNWRPEQTGDLSLVAQNISMTKGDLDFGVYFHMPNDKFYVGISGNHLLEPKLKEFTTTGKSNISRSINLLAGYKFEFSPKVSLQPSVMAKMQGPQMQIDINANLHVSPMVFGISHRLKDSFVGIVGFNATNNLFVGYSYDYTISKLGAATSGSHELVLSYTFPSLTKYPAPDLGTRDKKDFR